MALATDTTGSVTCPAVFNALYGLRPTIGLLSRAGILPTTISLDTPGIIATWMNVLAHPDKRDPLTVSSSVKRSEDYAKDVDRKWKNWRIGVLDRPAFWNYSNSVWANLEPDYKVCFQSGQERSSPNCILPLISQTDA